MSDRRPYGTGSLFVRTDSAGRETWYAKFRAGGRQRKRAIGPVRKPGTRDGLTKPQAEKALRVLMDTLEPRRELTEVIDITELARRYRLDCYDRGLKETYIEGSLQASLRAWLAPFFGDKPIDRITQEDIRDLTALMRQGERPGGWKVRPLSNKTITNHIWSTLSAMLKYAIDQGWLSHNPLQGMRAPKIDPSNDIKFLEADEVVALVANTKPGDYAELDAAVFLTAAKTGLRVGELIGLRWMDVDWKAHRVRVIQSWAPSIGKFTTPKSEKSKRSVPLVDEVAGALDRQFKRSPYTAPTDLVFADPLTGDPINEAHLRARYRWALERAGIDISHTLHHLRHTFGTRMAAIGTPMRTLQHWMGHKDISTTQRYADYSPAPEHELELVEMAFRVESLTTTNELEVATIAAWVREHHPEVWADATLALSGATVDTNADA